MSLTTVAALQSAEAAVLKPDSELFSKPLITGASISADWASLSPGKRLSQKLVSTADVKVVAQGGQTGASVLSRVTPSVLKDRSIVIGFDLFFWDSTRSSIDGSLKALKRLVAEAEALRIPVVIGDIPELIPGHQPSRKSLNEAIYRVCKSSQSCYVVPLDALYKQMLKDGFVEIKGQRYTFFDLVPDGLHIGSLAGDYLADLVYKTIRPTASVSR